MDFAVDLDELRKVVNDMRTQLKEVETSVLAHNDTIHTLKTYIRHLETAIQELEAKAKADYE